MSALLAIYDAATGDIVRRVTCSESVADSQCRAGEAAVEIPRGTIFTDATHYIDLSGPAPVLTPKPE